MILVLSEATVNIVHNNLDSSVKHSVCDILATKHYQDIFVPFAPYTDIFLSYRLSEKILYGKPGQGLAENDCNQTFFI